MKSSQSAQAHFAQTPGNPNLQRSVFQRNKTVKTTFDSGKLIPIMCDEVLPGDTIKMRASNLVRLATPIKPLMDNIYLDTHWFFCPIRILWDNWERFNGSQDNPGDSIDFSIPQMETFDSNGFLTGTMADYIGLPLGVDYSNSNPDRPNISAFPLRMYKKIFNDWYRDQNLQDSQNEELGNGPDVTLDGQQLFARGKRHDYFTSALLQAQKGDNVTIGLLQDVPVQGTGNTLTYISDLAEGTRHGTVRDPASAISAYSSYYNVPVGQTGATTGDIDSSIGIGITVTGESGLIAKTGGTAAVDINSLRMAIATQQLLEIDSRSGTRYVEMLKAHFGVSSPDFRLQRVEYLGGHTQQIMFNEVQQTTPSDIVPDITPIGNLSAFAKSNSKDNGFTQSFTEHGLLMGIVSVRADLTYQQGIPRMYSRLTRYDYYLPVFAHLGEQEILNQEIYSDGSATDSLVFGFQERWAEYRYNNNTITGKMRSNDPESLDIWHIAQDFTGPPALNSTFIEENIPMARILAVTDEPEFIGDFFFEMSHARVMPTYSTPGLNRL